MNLLSKSSAIHIKVLFMMCMLVLSFTKNIHAQNLELAGFKVAYYPSSNVQDINKDIKFSFQEYNAFVNIPVQLKNKKTILINGIDYVWVKSTAHEIPNSADIQGEERFHGISYSLRLKHDFNDKWSFLAMLEPTLAGDFETRINEKYFIFQGAAVAQYRINDFWKIGAGVAYTMRFGEPITLPLIMFNYNKGKHSLNTVLPAEIAYSYSLGRKENLQIGLEYLANGGQFYMANSETEIDIEKLTYTRANVSLVVKYRIANFIQLSTGIGMSNRRQYRLFDTTREAYNFDLKKSTLFNFGIALVPKNK